MLLELAYIALANSLTSSIEFEVSLSITTRTLHHLQKQDVGSYMQRTPLVELLQRSTEDFCSCLMMLLCCVCIERTLYLNIPFLRLPSCRCRMQDAGSGER
jgi:hypothetical protein